MKTLINILKNLIKPSLQAERAYQLAECRIRVSQRKVANASLGGY